MCTEGHRDPRQCIVPPHMLRVIEMRGDGRQANGESLVEDHLNGGLDACRTNFRDLHSARRACPTSGKLSRFDAANMAERQAKIEQHFVFRLQLGADGDRRSFGNDTNLRLLAAVRRGLDADDEWPLRGVVETH